MISIVAIKKDPTTEHTLDDLADLVLCICVSLSTRTVFIQSPKKTYSNVHSSLFIVVPNEMMHTRPQMVDEVNTVQLESQKKTPQRH